MKYFFTILILSGSMTLGNAQYGYWQQHVDYVMDIDFDVDNHRFDGKQKLKYTNKSPDTLWNVYYHLYFNAFQPGSMMDIRSRTLVDPDRRIESRIGSLEETEIGYHKIQSLLMNGVPCNYSVSGTILEVSLPQSILPGETVVFNMTFNSQVPVQIRRSGRDNAEGISYSMAQWYPKMCEYDNQGWHANPYIAREFHGVWGDFLVNISIDRKYTVAAGGKVLNASKMGHGYSDKNTKRRPFLGKKKLKWSFEAKNVHDFMWAADPDYVHTIKTTDQGTELHYFYDPSTANVENWEDLHTAMNIAEKYMNDHYGVYPYPVYAFVQGGDGGMEYPMATLITGNRNYSSLVGVSIHEWMHSWYQMVLATNESLYSWMDEGFTSYATSTVMNHLRKMSIIPGKYSDFPQAMALKNQAAFSQTGYEEPLSIHADHFQTNRAYGSAAYTKGSVFLAQLEYIVGKVAFAKAIKRYFNEWKFKHPTPNDFIRVFEKTAHMELDWYKEYMVNTTHFIDYAVVGIDSLNAKQALIKFERIGKMPMPLDVRVRTRTGENKDYYIPLVIMRGEKSGDIFEGQLCDDWAWVNPDYSLLVNIPASEIESVIIDPDQRMADVNLSNNGLSN